MNDESEILERLKLSNKKKMEEIQELLRQKNPHGYYLMAKNYRYGWGGIEHDTVKCIEYYAIAAIKDHAGACDDLARLYLQGNELIKITQNIGKSRLYAERGVNCSIEAPFLKNIHNYEQIKYISDCKNLLAILTLIRENISPKNSISRDTIFSSLPEEVMSKILTHVYPSSYFNEISKTNKFFYNFFQGINFYEYIKKTDENFTREDFKYCKNSAEVTDKQIFILFNKLIDMKGYLIPGSENCLSTFLLNLKVNSDLQKITYKLVMCSNVLFNKFSKGFIQKSGLIRSMGTISGFCVGPNDFSNKLIIDILFENEKFFSAFLDINDFKDLCKDSATIFKRLLLEKPVLAKEVLEKFFPYEVSSMLMSSGRKTFSDEDFEKLYSLGYCDKNLKYGWNFNTAIEIIKKEIGKSANNKI